MPYQHVKTVQEKEQWCCTLKIMCHCHCSSCRGERDREKKGPKLSNSEILKNLYTKLSHLSATEKVEIEQLLKEFQQVFDDVPKRTTCIYRDVDMGEASPIKQHPYRTNPIKLDQMRKEITTC